MKTQASLSDLIRQTVEAVRQEEDQGLESLYLPEGLDGALPLPERRRRERPEGPSQSDRPGQPAGVGQPAGTGRAAHSDHSAQSAQSAESDQSAQSARVTSLEALYAKYHRCTACALGFKRKHFVFGSGNEHADVMFVGEAPGAQEDEQGQPFVGQAGKLLTRILNAIDFTRDEVYITNILKCRPPNNRDPMPEEIDACDAILKEQIRLVRPRLICALGRVAAQALLKQNSSIRALRGRFHDYHGIKLLVTYHPSGLLRNSAYKRPTWEDVQLLRKEYDRIVQSDAQATPGDEVS
ncbi:MAG: uracil-DNA glycosylase [Gemmatimonadota bacterium]|nr:uracil-DNA glycosylase [Gemmatimonadota bacterium]